jgi:hypothetical protein
MFPWLITTRRLYQCGSAASLRSCSPACLVNLQPARVESSFCTGARCDGVGHDTSDLSVLDESSQLNKPFTSLMICLPHLQYTHYLNFLRLLNVSSASLFFQNIALCLHFPIADLDNLIAERRCNLFKGLVSGFTVRSVSLCCFFDTFPRYIITDICRNRVTVGVKTDIREIKVRNDQEEGCAGDENVVVVLFQS